MNKSRSRLMAGLAALTLAGFAATSYGQNTNTPATTGGSVSTPADQSAPAAQSAQPATPTGSANTQAAPTGTGTDATIGTSSQTTTTASDVTTSQPATTTFWLTGWGLAVIAVVAILLLWAIFGRRNRTVVSDSYSTSTRNYGTAPANERVVSPQAASGTERTTRVTDTDTRA
jgi:cobalamin biosynthesis Mg chelatase CobN